MYLPDVEASGNTATMDSMVPTAILGSELRNSQSPLQSYWQFIGDLSFKCVSLQLDWVKHRNTISNQKAYRGFTGDKLIWCNG